MIIKLFVNGNIIEQGEFIELTKNSIKFKKEEIQEISGVNMNEESIQMQKIQQFFNANAQVLKTVDDLFNALMRAF